MELQATDESTSKPKNSLADETLDLPRQARRAGQCREEG